MKLEVKHLAPYLPYGLKLQVQGEVMEDKRPILFNMVGIVDGEVLVHRINYIANVENEIEDCFPILRPLSDINTKIEVNGKKFVPIEVLGKLYEPNGNFEDDVYGWNIATGGDDWQDCYYEIQKLDGTLLEVIYCGNPLEDNSYVTEQIELSYTILLKLIEWHFDIFGLIKNKLAIDINTLS